MQKKKWTKRYPFLSFFLSSTIDVRCPRIKISKDQSILVIHHYIAHRSLYFLNKAKPTLYYLSGSCCFDNNMLFPVPIRPSGEIQQRYPQAGSHTGRAKLFGSVSQFDHTNRKRHGIHPVNSVRWNSLHWKCSQVKHSTRELANKSSQIRCRKNFIRCASYKV